MGKGKYNLRRVRERHSHGRGGGFLNIWIINPYALPPSLGGANRHHHLAAQLEKQGHRVTLISGSFDHFAGRQSVCLVEGAKPWRIQEVDGISYVWLSTPAYSGNGGRRFWNMLVFAARMRSQWQSIAKATEWPDVIVGSSLHLFGAAAAEIVARLAGSGFVLEIRDVWPATLVDLFGWSRFHPFVLLNGWLERRLYRRAPFIVSTLPLAEAHFRASGAGEDTEVFWIPNGVDCTKITPALPRFSANDKFTLLYAGSLGDANAVDDLIEAFAILAERGLANDFRVRILGDGPSRHLLSDQVRDLGLEEVIIFEGRIPKAEIPEQLQTADALLLMIRSSPIYRWGYSMNKLADYLLAGRPIIAADVSPYNPVADARAGLNYLPGDPESLADRILELWQMSPFERLAMGERGNAYARANFDFEKLSSAFEKVLLRAWETAECRQRG